MSDPIVRLPVSETIRVLQEQTAEVDGILDDIKAMSERHKEREEAGEPSIAGMLCERFEAIERRLDALEEHLGL